MAFYFCLDFRVFRRKPEAKPPVEHECAFCNFTGTWPFFSSKCLLFHNKIFEPNSEIRHFLPNMKKNMVFFKKNILYFCNKSWSPTFWNSPDIFLKSHPIPPYSPSPKSTIQRWNRDAKKKEIAKRELRARRLPGVRIGRFQGSISGDGRNPKQPPGMYKTLLLMEEILHHLIGSVSHYLQGFVRSRWCRISSINRMTTGISTTST